MSRSLRYTPNRLQLSGRAHSRSLIWSRSSIAEVLPQANACARRQQVLAVQRNREESGAAIQRESRVLTRSRLEDEAADAERFGFRFQLGDQPPAKPSPPLGR